jgi:CheY-like chemotaxis protein
MQMPELDGVETTRLIRADPTIADVPVILLTSIGHGRASLPHDLDLSAALSKPVKQEQLIEAVAVAARRAQAESVPVAAAAR